MKLANFLKYLCDKLVVDRKEAVPGESNRVG